jgi:hypothetical protein
MADNKFYRDSDVITDSHVVGKFRPAEVANLDSMNKYFPSQVTSLVIESKTNNHYIATYHQAEQWMKFDIVLFRLGTNTFVDVHWLADTGIDENSRPKDEISGYELLKGMAANCQHCAFRLDIKDNQIEFQLSWGIFLRKVIEDAPEMKTSPVGKGEVEKFIGSTEDLREFLIKHSSDKAAFKQRVLFIRSDK